MMLKLFLCFIVIISSTFLGNWFSLKLSRRCSDLFKIIEAINKIKTYIVFGGYEIRTVVEMSFNSKVNFSVFTSDVFEDDFNCWWNNCVKSLSKTTALNIEDRDLLMCFGANLGVTDIEGQISNCDLYIKIFEERLNDAKSMEKKNIKLYRTLGFSLGCTVSLIVL